MGFGVWGLGFRARSVRLEDGQVSYGLPMVLERDAAECFLDNAAVGTKTGGHQQVPEGLV